MYVVKTAVRTDVILTNERFSCSCVLILATLCTLCSCMCK